MPESSTMNPTPQTEAGRLADELDHEATKRVCNVAMMPFSLPIDAAKELRRLDTDNLKCDELQSERSIIALAHQRLLDERDHYRLAAKAEAKFADEFKQECDRLRAQLAESESERMEQSRLLGMSAERELALRAQVERLQGGNPVPSMHRILMQGAADMIKLLCSMKHGEMDLAGTDMGDMIDNLNAAANGQPFTFGEPSPAWVKAMTAPAQPAAPALVPLIARQLGEWHEDDGAVMWWAWNGREWVGEPAWCGTPNDSDWPGYHTHWTPHPAQPVGIGQPVGG